MDALLMVMNAVKEQVVACTATLRATPQHEANIINGWPSRNQLHELMQSGRTVISIWPPEGMGRDVTSYSPTPFRLTCPHAEAYLVATDSVADAKLVTFDLGDGEIRSFTVRTEAVTGLRVGEVVAIIFKRYNPDEEDLVASHVIVGTQTVQDILTSLADKVNDLAIVGVTTQILSNTPTSGEYSLQITFTEPLPIPPEPARRHEHIEVRVAAKSDLWIELSRVERSIWITVWAPTVVKRSDFSEVIMDHFALLEGLVDGNEGSYNLLPLENGSIARAFTGAPYISDKEQVQKVWRETIPLMVTYQNLKRIEATQVIAAPLGFEVTSPPGVTEGLGHSTRWPQGDGCFTDMNLLAQLDQLTIFHECD